MGQRKLQKYAAVNSLRCNPFSFSMDPTTLVSTFNALPRNKVSPSGSVPNHWHISLRQVPLDPPGHLLFIISPASRYVHVEGPLPPDYSTASTEVKATAVSMLLLKAFNDGLGAGGEGGSIGRPWSWACEDAELAGAVGEMLRGMGVVAPKGVGVAEKEENVIADGEWRGFFERLNNQVRVCQ